MKEKEIEEAVAEAEDKERKSAALQANAGSESVVSAKESPNNQAVRQVETLKEQPRVGKCLSLFVFASAPTGDHQLLVPFFVNIKLLQAPLFQMRQMGKAVPRSRRLSESKDHLPGHQVLLPAAVTALGAHATENAGKKSAAGIEARIEKGIRSARGVPLVVGGVDPPDGGTPLVIGNEKEGTGVDREPDGGAPVPPRATAKPAVGAGPGLTHHGGVGGTGAPLVVQARIGEAKKDDNLQ